jgi:hypothetical protein
MTVFSLGGSRINTDTDGQITSVQDARLDAVTRIGTNTLDVAYLGDPQNPFAISLSDYNLLFDKVHINDADLPSQVEFFDLSASDGTNIRVLNFVFEAANGIEELMFAIGSVALPQFRSPSDASLFFAQHEPVKVTGQDGWTIHLDHINNVETSGVFVNIEPMQSGYSFEDDGFSFIDLDNNSDIEVWDVEFAHAARAQDSITTALGHQVDPDVSSENVWDELENDISNIAPATELNEG